MSKAEYGQQVDAYQQFVKPSKPAEQPPKVPGKPYYCPAPRHGWMAKPCACLEAIKNPGAADREPEVPAPDDGPHVEVCGAVTMRCDCIGGPTVYPASCGSESAELKEIRAHNSKPGFADANVSALLRMVDELTETRRTLLESVEEYRVPLIAVARERNELRAKLVEAVARTQLWYDATIEAARRAEAAEARVRDLENKK